MTAEKVGTPEREAYFWAQVFNGGWNAERAARQEARDAEIVRLAADEGVPLVEVARWARLSAERVRQLVQRAGRTADARAARAARRRAAAAAARAARYVPCARCGALVVRRAGTPPDQPRFCGAAPCRAAYGRWRYAHDGAYRAYLRAYGNWRYARLAGRTTEPAPRFAQYRAADPDPERDRERSRRAVPPGVRAAVRAAYGAAPRRAVAARFGIAPSTVYAIWHAPPPPDREA